MSRTLVVALVEEAIYLIDTFQQRPPWKRPPVPGSGRVEKRAWGSVLWTQELPSGSTHGMILTSRVARAHAVKRAMPAVLAAVVAVVNLVALAAVYHVAADGSMSAALRQWGDMALWITSVTAALWAIVMVGVSKETLVGADGLPVDERFEDLLSTEVAYPDYAHLVTPLIARSIANPALAKPAAALAHTLATTASLVDQITGPSHDSLEATLPGLAASSTTADIKAATAAARDVRRAAANVIDAESAQRNLVDRHEVALSAAERQRAAEWEADAAQARAEAGTRDALEQAALDEAAVRAATHELFPDARPAHPPKKQKRFRR